MIPLLVPIGLALIRELAPQIVGMVTGSERAEQIAGDVVEAVGAATGQTIRTAGEAEAAMAALAADPELLAQVRLRMLDIAAAEHDAVMKDRASARERDVAVRGLAPNWRANIMLIAVTAGLVLCVWLSFAYPEAPQTAAAMIPIIVGAFLKMMGDAFAFEFGSSRGSADKSKTIEGMVRDRDALSAWRAGR